MANQREIGSFMAPNVATNGPKCFVTFNWNTEITCTIDQKDLQVWNLLEKIDQKMDIYVINVKKTLYCFVCLTHSVVFVSLLPNNIHI